MNQMNSNEDEDNSILTPKNDEYTDISDDNNPEKLNNIIKIKHYFI